MTTDPGRVPDPARRAGPVGRDRPPGLAQQRADVAAQREELGRTIAQLADRVDVRERVREQSVVLRDKLRSIGPDVVLGVIAGVGAIVLTIAVARYLRDPGRTD
jgi:hypothetical protein